MLMCCRDMDGESFPPCCVLLCAALITLQVLNIEFGPDPSPADVCPALQPPAWLNNLNLLTLERVWESPARQNHRRIFILRQEDANANCIFQYRVQSEDLILKLHTSVFRPLRRTVTTDLSAIQRLRESYTCRGRGLSKTGACLSYARFWSRT